MNKMFRYIIGVVVLAALVGCTGAFEDYNRNPYEPSQLSNEALIPGLISAMSSSEQNACQRNNTMWAMYGGYVTAPSAWGGLSQWAMFNIDDINVGFSTKYYFENVYPNWFNINRFTDGSGYFYQMAQLMRVYCMVIVASTQGPMPYTKIEDGKFYVPYDDEETVWHAMFDDLDAAIAEISANVGTNLLSAVDRVYGGDNVKWLKFANTLKLRMAIRISAVDPEFAKQKAEEAVASGVMTASSDSAYDNYGLNGFGVVGNNGDTSYHELRANACIVAYMNGYKDPRREKYFTPISEDTYLGMRYGIADYVRDDFRNIPIETYSGLVYDNSDMTYAPMPIMHAAEAAFLRAEGALKGWAMVGTPKELYEEGIRLSFEEWGASGVDSYLSSTSLPANHTENLYNCSNRSTCTVAWNEGDTDEKKLEKIITQKWIANFPLGHEGWCDFRRTGYPYLFPPVTNRSSVVTDGERGVRRIRFPYEEYNLNSANVRAAVSLLSNGSDSDNTDLWWALKEGKKY